ncbi:hypothetical protein BJ508DRAFT_375462 [Ascobolus immersus RN42]|uniref:Defective in cullin neddylation protein n=1 Tax=Ascobolus immersus RN42 TaxID=1160509 RepID=A0A3N4IB71_ASCIM|nr:hypothetical protein BJ508DRAFT_375462 [Ascobolus immersus RN42]
MPPKKATKQTTAAPAAPRRTTRSSTRAENAAEPPVSEKPTTTTTTRIHVPAPISPDQTPVKATTKKAAPKKAAPKKATPTKTPPTKAAPKKVTPTKTAPAKAAPTKTPPTKASPPKNPPAKVVPTKAAAPSNLSTTTKAGTKRKLTETNKVEADGGVAKKKPRTVEDSVSEWFNGLATGVDVNKDTLTTDSIMPWMENLNINLEGPTFLVMVYKLQVQKDNIPTLFEITRRDFVAGMMANKIKNNKELLVCLEKWLKELLPDPTSKGFMAFYNWCFQYVKGATERKTVTLEEAVEFMEVLLDPRRYKLHFSSEELQDAKEDVGTGKFPHRKAFCTFLREKAPVKGINKDQWESLLALNSTVPWSMESYNPMGAWPSLYDEYAEWHKEQYSSTGKSRDSATGNGSSMELDDEDDWQSRL